MSLPVLASSERIEKLPTQQNESFQYVLRRPVNPMYLTPLLVHILRGFTLCKMISSSHAPLNKSDEAQQMPTPPNRQAQPLPSPSPSPSPLPPEEEKEEPEHRLPSSIGKEHVHRPKNESNKLMPIFSGSINTINVLVADDNTLCRKIIIRLLTRHTNNIHACEDGAQALEAFHAANPPCDLAFIDCNMPQMDGLSLIKAIREFEEEMKREQRLVIVCKRILDCLQF